MDKYESGCLVWFFPVIVIGWVAMSGDWRILPAGLLIIGGVIYYFFFPEDRKKIKITTYWLGTLGLILLIGIGLWGCGYLHIEFDSCARNYGDAPSSITVATGNNLQTAGIIIITIVVISTLALIIYNAKKKKSDDENS